MVKLSLSSPKGLSPFYYSIVLLLTLSRQFRSSLFSMLRLSWTYSSSHRRRHVFFFLSLFHTFVLFNHHYSRTNKARRWPKSPASKVDHHFCSLLWDQNKSWHQLYKCPCWLYTSFMVKTWRRWVWGNWQSRVPLSDIDTPQSRRI